MKITKAQLKKFGKRATTTAAGIIAAAALAIASLADAPGELFSSVPQAQVVLCADAQDEQIGNTSLTSQKERLRDKLRRLFLGQPSIIRGVLLLPLWAAGKALLVLLSVLFTALNPVSQFILGILLNAALLFGLFLLVLKLLFPNLRLRDLLTKRNILLLTIGSIILSITDAILRTYWEDYRPISIAIKLGVGLLVLALLSWRIFGKRIRCKPAQAV